MFWFDQCISASGSDVEQQTNCITTRDDKCGNKTTKDMKVSPSSSSASSSATPTGGNSQESASPTGAAPAEASGEGAATAFAQFSIPLLVGGMAAVFGLAL